MGFVKVCHHEMVFFTFSFFSVSILVQIPVLRVTCVKHNKDKSKQTKRLFPSGGMGRQVWVVAKTG